MIYFSLGTNLDNRLENLREAVIDLKQIIPDLHHSIILETDAILPDNAPQSWNMPYLNMIAYGHTHKNPHKLLEKLKQIEKKIGRPDNHKRWSPRKIDIDIIYWDGVSVDESNLQIPHPELYQRDFLMHLMKLANPLFAPEHQTTPDCFTHSFVLFPELMGILNVTPDSFSDGGLFQHTDNAIKQALQLHEDGASIIDIGAQSTRPGATQLTAQEELERLMPVLDGLLPEIKSKKLKISIDTFWPEVINTLINNYPITYINDVSNKLNNETLRVIAESKTTFITMHSLSIPPQKALTIPTHINPIDCINEWIKHQLEKLYTLGFSTDQIIIDPGIGFGKTPYQNLYLMNHIAKLETHGVKLLVGHSRKSCINAFTTKPAPERDIETLAFSAKMQHHVDYLRVHNVNAHQAFLVAGHIT